jgi:FkbM family methyltransferase
MGGPAGHPAHAIACPTVRDLSESSFLDHRSVCSHPDDSFSTRFFGDFLHRCYAVHGDNTDFVRQAMESPAWASPKARAKQRLIDGAMRLARSAGVVHAKKSAIEEGSRVLRCIVNDLPELDRFYSRLDDDYSRGLMVELLLYRVLGRYRVKLSRNNQEYWQEHDSVDRDFLKEPGTMRVGGNSLGRYEVPAEQGSISLHGHPVNILNTFLLKQYEYRRSGRHLRAAPGDVVVDAGGCWGDTALYFADLVGPGGRVYVLEFVEDNLKVLQSNLNANPALASRIQVVQRAAWDQSDEILPYSSEGAATSLQRSNEIGDTGDGRLRTSTVSIDDLVAQEKMEAVDYVKMDIEGAEAKALAGAEKTIRSFRPKLAISLYHTNHDFAVIPKYIDDLNLNYRMFIDHFTIHSEETMLFAWPA